MQGRSLHALAQSRDVLTISKIDTDQSRPRITVILLRVLKVNDVVTRSQNIFEETTKRPGLLREGHQEVVTQTLMTQRAFHNFRVTSHIVIAA